jgi:molecular chaperone Hsp33
MASDCLQRLVFEKINARCVWVRLDDVLDKVLGDGGYPPVVSGLLSEALVVVALLSSGIKFSGRISLQLRGDGPLSLLMADCTADGGLRGIARLRDNAVIPETSARLFRQLAAAGTLTITLEPDQEGQRWQGIVPLEGDRLADAIEAYFERSEQLATQVRLARGKDCACALMLQRLPDEGAEIGEPDPDGWNRLQHLIATLGRDELLKASGPDLLHRLFHAEPRRLFPSRPLTFHCPCSRDRVRDVLRGLGSSELTDMAAEQEIIEVRCQFCNRAYHFDRLDIQALIQGPVDGSQSVH